MKRRKDRLHKVIVIGATPAGIAATNKLGELGIPVTLVDIEPDLDKKLSRDEWRLPSGVSMNFAHRPGLLRILRNPLIRTIMPAHIASIRHTPQGFRVKVRTFETFVDPELCTLCGRCLEICPVTTGDGSRPIQLNGRRSLPGRPIIDKRGRPPCQDACPLGVNAQAYIALSGAGRFREALDIVRRDNILPGICGRVCTHPCEEVCRRSELDEPLAIRDVKRFLADFELTHPNDTKQPEIKKRDERIAIIGSGPSGLAAAADLIRLGYSVTIFEKEAEAGGLLRYGIGAHRLPRDILDKEIEYIQEMGVKISTSSPVDLSKDIKGLGTDFDAVIIATGAWMDRSLGVPGEDLEGVEGCISFLGGLYRSTEGDMRSRIRPRERVGVIGDGNAAFDTARTLRRLGADVSIVTWFPEDLIPADPQEVIDAKEEGITIIDRAQVVSFSGLDGRMNQLNCRPTRPGEPDAKGIPWPVIVPKGKPFDLEFDRAIVAIGQAGPFSVSNAPAGVNITENGFIEVDENQQTSIPGLYAGGDATTGPSSVVEAMAGGRSLAGSVHRALSGEDLIQPRATRPEGRDFQEIPKEIPFMARPVMQVRQPASRTDGFGEVALGLSEEQLLLETGRCLQCGVCSECLICTEVCDHIGAINHEERSEEIIEQAGVVIIADPEAVPAVKGEDVIRAYGPKTAKPVVSDMITRGFAAAAGAMILLGRSSFRTKGHGVSFSPPDPELSQEVRLGVFVCRCNDSFGWSEGMEEYVEGLIYHDKVVYSEVINSACVPEGTGDILRAIRENDITRVVLASCVCCPLDFICSACTDQRTRFKEALFKGTGVSRSMVETCNLRGEVLPFLKYDEETAVNRFKGLLKRSMTRAERLRSLPSPARTYNFTTAVIGYSEAAVNSAQILAEAGLEVFMFGTPDGPMSDKPSHDNIHCFDNSLVKGMSGNLGNFQIFVESNGRPRVFQVGSIILGDKARRVTPYIIQEGLPGSIVSPAMQKNSLSNIPFKYPGMTSIAGLFLASPSGTRVSERQKGSATAALAAAVMPRGPRQSKGYTVVVDEELCRGCGRCLKVCPYHAISFKRNLVEGWHAQVDEALCKGCGNCISVCPSNAADSPYRDRGYLEQLIEEVIEQ